MSIKIKQEDINKVVWKACDTFRGVVDPSQYKDYILTMLFLKYVSDIDKSKRAEYMERYNGDEERARRAMRRERFQVPETSSFYYLYDNRNTTNKVTPNISNEENLSLNLSYQNEITDSLINQGQTGSTS